MAASFVACGKDFIKELSTSTLIKIVIVSAANIQNTASLSFQMQVKICDFYLFSTKQDLTFAAPSLPLLPSLLDNSAFIGSFAKLSVSV